VTPAFWCTAREVLEVDLVDDANARRYDLNVSNACIPHFMN
jgi:hypothetical protein